MKNVAARAERLAKVARREKIDPDDIDALRDWVDLKTSSELDATELDILTDSVWHWLAFA
jgi:hypothetical protein